MGLLGRLYRDIRIPPAVRSEFGRVPEGMAVEPVSDPALIQRLRRRLDAGESEVIALGQQIKNAHLILDDEAARAEAAKMKLTVIGTVGLVLRAKRYEVISEAKPLLDALQETGFWMSAALYEQALRLAEERA